MGVEEQGGEIVTKDSEDLREVLREKAKSSQRISWLLDECIRIPILNIRLGLDPILGLLPWGGEAVATLIGASVLGEACKKGIPFRTLIRMGANMIVNAAVGTIPFFGDLFSVWFKSNSRNYKMLREFLDSEEGNQAQGGWGAVLLIIAVVAVVMTLNLAAWVFLIYLYKTTLAPMIGIG